MITQAERTSSQPALEAVQELESILQEFDLWAVSADRRGSGWESDYPQWRDLMDKAEQIMAQEHQSEQAVSLLGRCWALSHEDETCTDWAREHIQNSHVRGLVFHLTNNADPDTRWQAYDALNDLQLLDSETQDILKAGTKDENSYVRRRAFLVLFHHPEVDVRSYIERMLTDADAYNRYIAVNEGKRLDGEALQDHIQAVLQDPEVAFLFSLVNLPQPDRSLAFISYYENKTNFNQ